MDTLRVSLTDALQTGVLNGEQEHLAESILEAIENTESMSSGQADTADPPKPLDDV